MKTIFNWLLELPDDISSRALKNAISQIHRNRYDIYEYEVDNIRDAINLAFIWGGSYEGYEYWNSIHIQYRVL